MVHQFGASRFSRLLRQVAKMIGAETPGVLRAGFEYPNVMATWTLNYCNSFDNGWSIQFQGDKGTMIVDEAGFRVWKEPWKDDREPIHRLDAVPIESHI